MKKNGFTLIELIVSIVLVSVILVSLLATLVKLKQTYEVLEEDSDIRIYSSSITRHINNDIISNKGIKSINCNDTGTSCNIKLSSGEERVLEIHTSDKGTKTMKDEAGKITGYRRTDLSTINYYDKKTNKTLFIRTIEQENRQDNDKSNTKITTYGYKFIGISFNKYSYKNKKDNSKSDVINVLTIHTSDETYNIKIYGTEISKEKTEKPTQTGLACTSGKTLTQGAEYKTSTYTYRYKQEAFWTRMQGGQFTWYNISADGWGVQLTNLSSTSPVTEEICTTIDGKPIVSTSHMFIKSASTSIDISTLKSDNVVNMASMFEQTTAKTIIGLDKLNTSNVTNMNLMFSNTTNLKTLDLSSFDTSNVTSMNYIFRSTGATTGYARNSSEANKLNALSTSYKPSTLTFTVK